MPKFGKVKTNKLIVAGQDVTASSGSVMLRPSGTANAKGSSFVYHVDRNVSASGDGTTWDKAFKTITEAITQVNSDYTNSYAPGGGRNRTILIGEGWFSEVGMTLTASDVHIIGVASGSNINDGTILYGSENAAGWDDEALVPALTVMGWSNTIENIGFFNYANGLYSCVSMGTSTPAATASHPCNNAMINCFFPRDVADKYTYAIADFQQEGARYEGCRFSQSAKTAGIYFGNQNPTIPVSPVITNCTFIGCPTGIASYGAGHSAVITHNIFMDATDERNDTSDYCLGMTGWSGIAAWNMAPGNTLAQFNSGTDGNLVQLANLCSDSTDDTWPIASA